MENLASAISAHLTAWETSDSSSYEAALSLLAKLLVSDDLLQALAQVSEAKDYLSRRRRSRLAFWLLPLSRSGHTLNCPRGDLGE
jgi:hypothetical protein